jgi:ABC-type nickel/cobalt efflux system permease component RcnA
MAAYLVGQRGSFRQAMVVASAVTATHTAGVLALGIAISASAVVAPERLYPWLGAASGVLLAVIGLGILRRAVRRRGHDDGHPGHDHDEHEHHEHEHGAHDHIHSHGGRPHRHGPLAGEQLMTWRGLLAMGFVGGLLPSPSAVVVLLGAIALGRAWFGVLLVIVYGLGMAATLTGAGLLLLRARRALDRRATALRPGRLVDLASRLVPTATAAVIVVVGVYLTARGVAQI